MNIYIRGVTILEVETKSGEGRLHLMLKGELDLSTVEQVEQELDAAEARDEKLLVIDLSRLTFLDSTGLRLMVTADQRARQDGRRLVIVRGPDTVQRVFSITKLDETLEMVDDLSEVTNH